MVSELVGGIDDFVPVYKGTYDATIEYDLNDICAYQNKIYWHIGKTPTIDIDPSNTDTWQVFINNINVSVNSEILNII